MPVFQDSLFPPPDPDPPTPAEAPAGEPTEPAFDPPDAAVDEPVDAADEPVRHRRAKRRPGARRATAAPEPRRHRLPNIHVGDDEYDAIEAAAEAADLAIAAYVRRSALNGGLVVDADSGHWAGLLRVLLRAHRDVRGLVTNANQAAKAGHMGDDTAARWAALAPVAERVLADLDVAVAKVTRSRQRGTA